MAKEVLKVTSELVKSNEGLLLEDEDDVAVDMEQGVEIGDMDNGEDDDFFPADDYNLEEFDPDYEEMDVRFLDFLTFLFRIMT